MITVSATALRKDLFTYLDRAAAGEIVLIQRNNQKVAHLVPITRTDWRDNMKIMPKLLVSPEELMESLDDIWEAYL